MEDFKDANQEEVLETSEQTTSNDTQNDTNQNETVNETDTQSVDWEKRFKDQEKLIGKWSTELGMTRKELEKLRDLEKRTAPALEYWESIQKQQKQQQFQSQWQQNPQTALEEMINARMQEALRPYEEKQVDAESIQSFSQLQQIAGENFETMRDVMADVLNKYVERDKQQGTDYAVELAKNPRYLYELAEVEAYRREKSSKSQVANARQKQIKDMSGIATKQTSGSVDTGLKGKSSKEIADLLRKKGVFSPQRED